MGQNQDALEAEKDEAIARLVADAGNAVTAVISVSLIATAIKAEKIAAAIKDSDDFQANERELQSLRSDMDLNAAIAGSLLTFKDYLDKALPQWLADGWLMQAKGMAAAIEMSGRHLSIDVEITDADRATLSTYNVMGYTCAELSKWLVAVLRNDIDGALGRCLLTNGASDVIASLGQVQDTNISRVQQQARQSFLAGTGAARDSMAKALAGG